MGSSKGTGEFSILRKNFDLQPLCFAMSTGHISLWGGEHSLLWQSCSECPLGCNSGSSGRCGEAPATALLAHGVGGSGLPVN